MALEFVDLDEKPASRRLLAAFYHDHFVPGFPDPDERESLETLEQNLVKRAEGFYGKNSYHIVLGLDGGEPVAACIGDYLAASNCGAIEYILVAPAHRRQGIGRAIHDHTVDIIHGRAATAGAAPLNAVMIEMNDPYLAPAALDNEDPFERLLMWQHWGYRRLRFPYQQPALSAEQSAIDYLLLGVKPLAPALTDGFPTALASQLVVDYLVWANRLTQLKSDPFHAAMRRYAAEHATAPLERLDAYIGRDPARPLAVRPIDRAEHPDLGALIAVYERAFAGSDAAVPPGSFARALARQRPSGTRYHAWALSRQPQVPVAGMATFYATPTLGFVGYLVLEGELRGKGLARVVLKRIEEQLVRDRPGISHLYAECERGSPQERAFAAMGFRRLDLPYHQPPLAESADRARTLGPAMSLMRKHLGDPVLPEDAPDLALLRREIAELLREVYGLAAPEDSACFRLMFP